MLSTVPSSPCSVVNKRSFGKLERFSTLWSGGGRGGGKSTKCSKSFVRGCRGNCPKKALKQRWGNSADGKSKRRYRWTKLIYSPLWKCFWKDAVWSYLSCKTLLRSRALRYVVSLMIKKSQLPKVGTKVVRGFSFLAELSFLALAFTRFNFRWQSFQLREGLEFIERKCG